MVDYKILSGKIISRSNDKQNSYLSNIFGVGGGAVMYTIWQMLLTEVFGLELIVKALAMLVLSVVLLFFGYSFIGSPYETNNS